MKSTTTKIPCLADKAIYTFSKVGLPRKFAILNVAYDYAQNKVTEEEWVHFFLDELTPSEQKLITEVIKELAQSAERYEASK